MLRLRHFFITGLLVWLPIGVTAWVVLWLISLFDTLFRALLEGSGNLFPSFAPLARQLGQVPGLGVVLALVLVLATGLLFANIFGQWLLGRWDWLMGRIPFVRTIYSSVKQVSDTLFSDSGQAFSRALLIEWPRRGSWTIAFLTGAPSEPVAGCLPGDCVSVFVPTAPNPTSGYVLMLPRADAMELDMSVDEALKYVISMGVIAPSENHRGRGGKAADRSVAT